MMRTLFASSALISAALTFTLSSLALEPAGGPPGPDPAAEEESWLAGGGREAPDASVDEPRWLSHGSSAPALAASGAEAGGGGSGLALGAFLIVIALGGSALVLHQRRGRKAAPGRIESRLEILSSTRVGAKANVVSAKVGGRVMLLGVTDHTVTHLGWLEAEAETESLLDAAGASDKAIVGDAAGEAPDEEALPADYPGSALRAATSAPFASSLSLSRFQEVLRGVHAKPSARSPLASSEPPSAASTLAELTTDVVISKQPSPTVPASSRRKRQRRQESSAKSSDVTELRAVSGDAAVEGQVAGLLAHKARRDATNAGER